MFVTSKWVETHFGLPNERCGTKNPNGTTRKKKLLGEKKINDDNLLQANNNNNNKKKYPLELIIMFKRSIHALVLRRFLLSRVQMCNNIAGKSFRAPPP